MPESTGGGRGPLDLFFAPKSVAVIGASPEAHTVGHAILRNLIGSPFGGAVYPVNPKHDSVLGIRAYPNVAAVPGTIELAIIVTPAATVPGVIRECARAGVKAAVIVSAGFREAGAGGLDLERGVLEEARAGGIRLIGPNCLGVMSTFSGLNATFASAMALQGSVAFISQSGAMCTAILDWSLREQVGFSAFVSVGSMLDLGWGDLITYLGNDPHTRSIVIYMESVGDARAFLSAAREVALQKPIIVIKAGRTERAAKAAASHTGSMTGSDDVLDAAFRRCGVLRVNSVSDIFYMTEVLASQPRPRGPKLLIVTNAGGPGVLATDALLGMGGELAELSTETIAALNEVLPRHWSHSNPVDIIGDARADRYTKAVEIASKNVECDGLLVIMAPQGLASAVEIAESLRPFAKMPGKPILASWMGGEKAAQGEAVLNNAGIPTFPFPETAVRAFHYMWKYSVALRGLYETPVRVEDSECDPTAAGRVIEAARQAGRTLLSEIESKQILQAYGIPVAEATLAASEDEAVNAAAHIGYPVALKLHSLTITHKTEAGGVMLGLRDAAAVRAAFGSIRDGVDAKDFAGATVEPMLDTASGYELILGSNVDAQFGPVLLFGAGGQLVEVLQDRSLALPPLNTTLARRCMEQTRIYTALTGVRGRKPVDMGALEGAFVRFSQLVAEQTWIREIDINPLLATPSGVVALDARVVLWDPSTDPACIPKPAIRIYPSQYIRHTTLNDGAALTIRPIRPEDEPLIVAFHSTLSERSVYLRYFHWMKLDQRTDHDRLARLCFIDYDRQMALVAVLEEQIAGIGRLVKSPTASAAELAVIVSDKFQRRGLGCQLVDQLVAFARDERLKLLTASVLLENLPMQKILEKAGFRLTGTLDSESLDAELAL